MPWFSTVARVGRPDDLARRLRKLERVLPTDGICDSGHEKFAFEAKDLPVGTHRIAVRVEDIFGNVGFGTVTVTVGK